MRFVIPRPPARPRHGETRVVRKFAWFPTFVRNGGDRVLVWLEHFTEGQTFNNIFGDFPAKWRVDWRRFG